MIQNVNRDFYERLLISQIVWLFGNDKEKTTNGIKNTFIPMTKATDHQLPEYTWFTYALDAGASINAFAENLERIIFINLNIQDKGQFALKTLPLTKFTGDMDIVSGEWVEETFKPYCRNLLLKHSKLWYAMLSNKESRGGKTVLNELMDYYSLTLGDVSASMVYDRLDYIILESGIDQSELEFTKTRLFSSIPEDYINLQNRDMMLAAIAYWPKYYSLICDAE